MADEISPEVRALVVKSAQAAARQGLDMTVCPYAAQDTPRERALAHTWVAAYLGARPPMPDAVQYTDDEPGSTVARAGRDDEELHHYWTRDPEGLGKWVKSDHPWTSLVEHLTPHVGPERAKTYASRWFIEVFGFAAGSDLNRVTHGHPPRGHRVGPG